MPTYVFQCKKCERQFEELCSFEERTRVRCPGCRSKRIQPLIHQVEILGPTSSKLDNHDYRAQSKYASAENESRSAREEAVRRGLNPYRNIDDISSGVNFDPANWKE